MDINSFKVKGFFKVVRFFRIYGLSRTYVKIMGRIRITSMIPKLPWSFVLNSKKDVAIIGAGQFSFATISFFLKLRFGKNIFGVYDVDKSNTNTLVNYYGGQSFDNPNTLIESQQVKFVFIASNHFTHTEYAIKALQEGKIVYVEKPISVNKEQFDALSQQINKGGELYVGYNRPFSPAIKQVRGRMVAIDKRDPLTLNCFITGHKLPQDHWYRNPIEGTRVCGNLGHWLDLSINLLNAIGLPKSMRVKIHYSSEMEKDDNLAVTMSTEKGDLIAITLSSREEPFEGINETINLQYSHLIAKIDDFRRMKIWDDHKIIRKRYFRKDVGHKNAIYQPYDSSGRRDLNEVLISTRLMLEITYSLKNNIEEFIFRT